MRKGWQVALLVLVLMMPSRMAQAHGGTPLKSGTSPSGRYGWMLSISPDPILTGPFAFSLIIFDTKTSVIVNTVAGEVYLTAPGDTQASAQRGPFPLLADPMEFGDLVTFVPIDQTGVWDIQIQANVVDDAFAVDATFEILEQGGLAPADIQAAVAEQTRAMQNQTQAAAQAVSPLPTPPGGFAQPTSPLASPLASPVVTPTLPPATQASPTAQPAVRDLSSPAQDNRIWWVAGGIVMIMVGVALIRRRNKP